MNQTLTTWLAARDPRERLLLTVGAIVVVATVLTLGVWQPLRASHDAEMARVARYDRMLTALSQLPATARSFADPRPIAAVLTQTAATQGLTILRLDTPKPDTATLALQDAPFDMLVLWIDGLNRDAGLTVIAAHLRRSAIPGTVSADLSLERPAP